MSCLQFNVLKKKKKKKQNQNVVCCSCDYYFNPLQTEWTPPHYILKDSNFNFRYVRLCDLDTPREKMIELFANSGDPDQMPLSEASDLGLHRLQITLFGVSRLQWVEGYLPGLCYICSYHNFSNSRRRSLKHFLLIQGRHKRMEGNYPELIYLKKNIKLFNACFSNSTMVIFFITHLANLTNAKFMVFHAPLPTPSPTPIPTLQKIGSDISSKLSMKFAWTVK